MLNLLTRAELHNLHDSLCRQHTAQHKVIMTWLWTCNDTIALQTDPGFLVFDASHREVNELATEVYEEIQRRDAEKRELSGA
jgi:hypothetical protein